MYIYIFSQSLKIHCFCCGPISVDPSCPQPNDITIIITTTITIMILFTVITIMICFTVITTLLLPLLLLQGIPLFYP